MASSPIPSGPETHNGVTGSTPSKVPKVEFGSLREDDKYVCPVDGLTAEQMRNPLIDRILGTIYGNALADAFSVKTEFLTKAEVPKYYSIPVDFMDPHRTRHACRWLQGDHTDDFDQALLIMETITEAHEVHSGTDTATNASTDTGTRSEAPSLFVVQPDMKLFARKLKNWALHGFPEIGDTCGNGLGSTTAAVLFDPNFLRNPQQVAAKVWHKQFKRQASPNGSNMRTSITGVYRYDNLLDVARNTIDFCTVTHADPRCVASSLVQTFVIAQMLQGQVCGTITEIDMLIKRAYQMAIKCVEFDGSQEQQESTRVEIRSYLHPTLDYLQLDEGLDGKSPNKIGYALKAMGAGLFALRSQQDWASTIHALLLEGGDADSTSSVGGSLLGCRLGYHALPQLWLAAMPYKKWIDAKVVKFLKVAMKLI